MADFRLGRLKFNWTGDWTVATDYVIDDIVKFGANRLISSDHWVIIDLGTMIRVRGFGFPSMVAINWMVLPRPGSSQSNPPLGPEVCASIVRRNKTPSLWYGANSLPLRVSFARLYCSSIDMVSSWFPRRGGTLRFSVTLWD